MSVEDQRSLCGVLWTDFGGITHECVTDDDDHRVLIMKCGDRLPWVSAARRRALDLDGTQVNCMRCLIHTEAA